ncbi:MAG: MBL fold metallo-hydrolase [candidate division WOR-3 bacterium]
MGEKEIEYINLDYSGWKKLSEEWNDKSRFFESVYFIYGFDLSSNIYIINTGDGLVMIDGGNDYTSFLQLRDIGFSHGDIKKIILTHGHPEHVMGVIELLRYPEFMRNTMFEVVMHESAPKEFKNILDNFKIKYTFVSHGDKIEVGDFLLEVVHTPGHTFDSICFFEATTKTLFSGDTVLPFAYASSDPNAGGREDYHLLSLKMLERYGISNLLPGHGPVVYGRANEIIKANKLAAIKKMVGEYAPWSEIAVELAKKRWFEEAIDACDVAIGEDPNNLEIKKLKASILNDLGRFDEASKLFAQLEDILVNDPFVKLGKAISSIGMGKFDEAMAILDSLKEKYSNVKEVDVYRGICFVLKGEPEKAMEIDGFRMEFVKSFEKILSREKFSEDKGKT